MSCFSADQSHVQCSGPRQQISEMQPSSQDLTCLVLACTIVILILHALCYVMGKIRNLAVHVMGWKPRPAEKQPRKPPVEHDCTIDYIEYSGCLINIIYLFIYLFILVYAKDLQRTVTNKKSSTRNHTTTPDKTS